MARFYQDGRHLDLVPAVERQAGELVQIGSTVGIVDPTNHGGPLAAGELGSASIRCVVELDNSGVAFAWGDTVGYDAAADEAVVGAGGTFDAGICVNPGGAGATESVRVLLAP